MRIVDIVIHLFVIDCDINRISVINASGDKLSDILMPLLASNSHQIRLHVLRILSVIYSDIIDSANNVPGSIPVTTVHPHTVVHSIIERCLKAERIKLGPQTVRDFLMHILQLHADRDVKNCLKAAEIALRYLFGLLHIQFTAIWPSVYEAIAIISASDNVDSSASGAAVGGASVEHSTSGAKVNWSVECKNLFWSLFQPLLFDVEARIANVKDLKQESSNSPDESVYSCSYETAILWFTYTRPDLYSLMRTTTKKDLFIIESRKQTDWITYRLCLWKCLRWKCASKNTRFLTPLLLNTIR
ncbi:unnamed protein product [Trichobilharzia regenti]|nr:unnamed protein product [Trichobilharzia regenti]